MNGSLKRSRGFKPHLWLVRLAGVIVPRLVRGPWRKEWEAELETRERLLAEWDRLSWRSKINLSQRSLGAFWDAIWLQQVRLESDFSRDLRYAFRMLVKSPGFAAVSVLTIALGIGANTAIFSVVNAVLLRPMPYRDSTRLGLFYYTRGSGDSEMLTPAVYLSVKNAATSFSGVATWGNDTWPVNLTGEGEPERLQGFKVSGNLFDVLGVSPAIGRTFLDEEDQPGNNHVVVISDEFWRRRFGADPQIIGRSLILNGSPYQVVGVMPSDFRFILKTDLWTPLAFTPAEVAARNGTFLHPLIRLKPGVSMEQARVEVQKLIAAYLNIPDSEVHATLRSLQETFMGFATEMLLTLLGSVAFVLLIGCTNIANLLLARASGRRRELSIRAALGASRLRIVRQLLVEGLLLSFIGGVVALLIASWSIKALVSELPDWIAAKNANVASLGLDGTVLGYAAALSLLTTVIFALAPAIQVSRVNLSDDLKESGRGNSSGRRQSRLRSLFVVSEVALAVVLLVGSALMVKSLWRVANADRGFNPKSVLTAKIDPAGDRYRAKTQLNTFYEDLLNEVESIPGVAAAGLTNGFLDWGYRVDVAEHASIPDEANGWSSLNPVSKDFFSAMEITLRSGRLFNERDSAQSAPVAIIDETVARRYFADENPLGQHLRWENSLREIVGVVEATRAWKTFTFSLDDQIPRVYLPYQQMQDLPATMALMVRSKSEDPTNLIPSIRARLSAIDNDQPIHSFQLLEQTVADLRSERRFSTTILSVFAALAIVLAAVGIYGVLAYSVSQRTKEMGIRFALGARSSDVLKLVIGQGMRTVLIGLLLGMAGSLGLSRWLESMLFEVRGTDPTTYVVIGVILSVVALAACLLPAMRAARVDPVIALRSE